MTSAQAKKAMPKFHGEDFVASRELEEEDLSETELNVNGLFDIESDEEDEEEAIRRDLRERQNLMRAQMQKDAADELRDYRNQLLEKNEEMMKKAREEAHRTKDKQESAELNHRPDRVEATDEDREDLKRQEDEIEKERAASCEAAMNSDEERAADARGEHLNYIAQVRFDEECKHRKAEAEEKALEEEKRKQDEAEYNRHLQKQKEEKILRDRVVAEQVREQDQIEEEYKQQQKEKSKRMAFDRAAVLKRNIKEGTENRRENVEMRQGAHRRAKVNLRRDDNLFMEPMVPLMEQERNVEPLDNEFESEDSEFESEDSEFDSDTPLMDGVDSGYISFEDMDNIELNADGRKMPRL